MEARWAYGGAYVSGREAFKGSDQRKWRDWGGDNKQCEGVSEYTTCDSLSGRGDITRGGSDSVFGF